MAQAQVHTSAPNRKQQVENAMTSAVLSHLSKDFNKPKLYEVTITESIQPDIVGFILATKKKLFCMTLEELQTLFPQQSFLGVNLKGCVGPEAVHRVNPFTPDENMKAMVNKYLAKREPPVKKAVKEEKQPARESSVEYEDLTSSDEDTDEYFSEEESDSDITPPETPMIEKHVTFEKVDLQADRKSQRPRALKRTARTFHPSVTLQPPPTAKRSRRLVPILKQERKAAAGDVTHNSNIKRGKHRMHSLLVNNRASEHAPLIASPEADYSASGEHTPPPLQTPPQEEIADILGRAAAQAEIVNHNTSV